LMLFEPKRYYENTDYTNRTMCLNAKSIGEY
jgi:hypothetical protein